MSSDSSVAAAIEALGRAQRASQIESARARSGAFGEQVELVLAIVDRARLAQAAMASWEAINDALAPEGQVAAALEWHGLSAIGQIRSSLIESAFLGAFTLTDQVGRDRATLCQIAAWLDDRAFRSGLISRQWLQENGCPDGLIDHELAENKRRIERFRQLVVSDWKVKEPVDRLLLNLRESLRDGRLRLAHTITNDFDRSYAVVDQYRQFVRLTLELATDVCLIWTGSSVPADEVEKASLVRAKNFWALAFAKPVELMNEQLSQQVDD